MDWTVLITELTQTHRMKQPEIAAACKCGQSTISEIARGVTKDPRHSIGESLRKLLETKRSEAAAKKRDTATVPASSAPGAAGQAAAAAGG